MEISVLQWNIWLDEPIEHIIEELRHIDADILCLQELTTQEGSDEDDRPQRVARELGFNVHYAQGHSWREDGVVRGMGNAVLSRYPLSRPRSVMLREPGGSLKSRVYTEAVVTSPGGDLVVGTAHLSYIPGHVENDDKREEVGRLIEAIGDNPSRRLLTGDFNVTPASWSIPQLRGHLVDAGPGETQATWTTKPYIGDDFQASTLDWRLDYVFVSPDLVVQNSRILETEWSDHLPILVSLTV